MRLLLSFTNALLVVTANAQQDFEYWSNADYDPSIPIFGVAEAMDGRERPRIPQVR